MMFRKLKNRLFPPLPRVDRMACLVRRKLQRRVSATVLSMAIARGRDLIRHGLEPDDAASRVVAWALCAQHPAWAA